MVSSAVVLVGRFDGRFRKMRIGRKAGLVLRMGKRLGWVRSDRDCAEFVEILLGCWVFAGNEMVCALRWFSEWIWDGGQECVFPGSKCVEYRIVEGGMKFPLFRDCL